MSLNPCRLESREGQMWCLDCQRFHIGHTVDIALDPGEKGQKYRAIWRRMPSKPGRPLLRSLPLAQQCCHRGKLLDKTKCGSEVWACNVHGTCSLQPGRCSAEMALCQACTSYESPTTANIRSQNGTHENPALTTGFSRSQQYQIDEAVGYAHQGPKQHLATMKQHQTNEKKVVPLTVLESRLAVCRSGVCGRMKRDTCDMAGFALSNERFSWAVSSCPMGLWSTYVDSREHDTKPALSHLPG